jgi:predicted O-methyltransferase YrrM
MRAIYAPVSRRAIVDSDLCTFISFLYQCVRILRPRVIVQTGTAAGTSTMAMALAIRENGFGHVYTIDPEPPEYFGIREPVAIARRIAGAAQLDQHIAFIRGYSTVALDGGRMALPSAPQWSLPSLYRTVQADMVVIDGDHTLLGCFLDLVHGSAGLARDGPRIIVCHDYLGIADVRAAVSMWRPLMKVRDDRLIRTACGIKFIQLA